MQNWKLILMGLIAAIVALLILRLFIPKAGAHQVQNVCFCHNLTHNPHTICTSNQGFINGHMAHVQSGFDSLGVCQEATPTPTEEPKCEEDCITPSVTPTPTEPTVTPEPPVRTDLSDGLPSDPGATKAHVNLCNGVMPDKPIIKVEEYRKLSDTSAHFGFWPAGHADGYVVEYGYSPDHLDYGIPGGLPPTSTGFDLNDLKPGFTTLFARVTAKWGECYTSSEVAN